jgi:hypothetical protein
MSDIRQTTQNDTAQACRRIQKFSYPVGRVNFRETSAVPSRNSQAGKFQLSAQILPAEITFTRSISCRAHPKTILEMLQIAHLLPRPVQ